jgi:hypothetical protein
MKHVALVIALCATAHAGTRAWTAAKKVLPSGLMAVFDVDVQAARGSKLWQSLAPTLIAQKPDVGTALEKIKTTCGLDPMQAVESVVAGVDENGQGAFVIALKGITQKDVEACIGKNVETGKKLAVTKAGALTKYSDGTQVLYARWLDKTTLAISTSPEDKDITDKTTGGGIAKDKTMMTGIAGVKLDSTMWAVIDKEQPLEPLQTKMTQLFGSVTIAGGKVDADVHLVLPDAAAATTAATNANTQLGAVKTAGQLPPKLAPIFKSLAIKSVDNQIVVTDSASEPDVLAIIQQVMQ